MTIDQLLIKFIDQQAPKMLQANGYEFNMTELVKGNWDTKANSNCAIVYELGVTELNPIGENQEIYNPTTIFALYYKMKNLGTKQGVITEQQERAILDLRRFIEGDNSINPSNTLAPALFEYANKNDYNIHSLSAINVIRSPDAGQGNFKCGVIGRMTYIESNNNINHYQAP